MLDPTDFIVELIKPDRNSRFYPNIVYRLKQWKPDIKRYEFLGDYPRVKDINLILLNQGINPSLVVVVDLLEPTDDTTRQGHTNEI